MDCQENLQLKNLTNYQTNVENWLNFVIKIRKILYIKEVVKNMAELSKDIEKLIEEYKEKFCKKPQPFWYAEWDSQEDYAEYLKEELKNTKNL